MDFKIKIDLSNQQIINDTPVTKKKHKKKALQEKEVRIDTVNKEPNEDKKFIRNNPENKRKKLIKKKIKKINPEPSKLNELEKPKINFNSIISLTLPNNENTKGDQAQKLGMLSKKKPRHWERRWVLIQNVFEFTKEIWLKKWVLVDEGEDITDNSVSNIKMNIIISYKITELPATILLQLHQTA